MSGQTLAYLGQFFPDLGFDPIPTFAPVATLAGWSHVRWCNPSVLANMSRNSWLTPRQIRAN